MLYLNNLLKDCAINYIKLKLRDRAALHNKLARQGTVYSDLQLCLI
jgi:hypothetical protein